MALMQHGTRESRGRLEHNLRPPVVSALRPLGSTSDRGSAASLTPTVLRPLNPRASNNAAPSDSASAPVEPPFPVDSPSLFPPVPRRFRSNRG